MARRKRKPSHPPQGTALLASKRWLVNLFSFFVGSGILVVLLQTAYQDYLGNVSIEFVQAAGRGYEFVLKNDTPSDRTVKSFRLDPPRTQNSIYKVSEDLYARVNDLGQVILPGGNMAYVPAAEFKELDGQKITANSSLKFRIPPLSSRTWMQPEATIVDLRLELEPTNSVLAAVDTLLDFARIRSRVRTIRYLVIENYWIVSNSASINEAIRIFCRDNDSMAKSSICANER